MPYLNSRLQDFGLSALQAEADVIHVCSGDPADFAAVAVLSLGSASASISPPTAGAGTSRKVTVAAVLNGSVTGTGEVTHWALVDTANARLWASNSVSVGQAVVTGNEFNLAGFDIALGGV
jgi:hypothetical protein